LSEDFEPLSVDAPEDGVDEADGVDEVDEPPSVLLLSPPLLLSPAALSPLPGFDPVALASGEDFLA
jgi:hypothetical protein